MEEPTPIARRGTPRYELAEVLSGRTHCSFHVRLVDLSSTGALIEYQQYMRPGIDLTLMLPLGGSDQEVKGTVVHCSPQESLRVPGKVPRTTYRIGIRFMEIPAEARRVIHELIRERMENERREQPRLFIGCPARLEEAIELKAVNLGAKGGLFASRSPMEFGTEHDFVFRLPTGEVRARGVVRHCQATSHEHRTRFHVGIEFTDFLPQGQETLLKYLRALEK